MAALLLGEAYKRIICLHPHRVIVMIVIVANVAIYSELKCFYDAKMSECPENWDGVPTFSWRQVFPYCC